MAILSSADMFYTAYEPKLQNRFIFYIDGIPAYLVKTADKPKYSAEEVVLDVVEEWICKGAYVTNAEFGSGDWSSSEPMMINLTIAMDYAILNY